jgi:hypothetical protein
MTMHHYLEISAGQSTYQFATFTQGSGHHHPRAYYVLGGPDSGMQAPSHARPEVVPDRDDWSVELPVVLWLLDEVSAGTLTPDRMRELLVECTSPPSGCCWACEDIETPEAELLAALAAKRDQWIAWWNTVTGDTHPYAVSASPIHSWDCRHVDHPSPPPAFTSKHEYAHRDRHEDHARRGHKRLTVDEARAWIAPYHKRKYLLRCKVCAPALPDAWRDSTSDVPSTH